MPRTKKGRKSGGAMAKILPMLKKLSLEAKSSGGRKRRRRVKGGFGFSDLWDGVKKAAEIVNPILKSTKVISKGLNMVPGVGGIASSIADSLGYGKRRVVRKVSKGGYRKLGGASSSTKMRGGYKHLLQ